MRKTCCGPPGPLVLALLLAPLLAAGQESGGRALLDEVEVVNLSEGRVLSGEERNPQGSFSSMPGYWGGGRVTSQGLEAPEEGAIGILFNQAEYHAANLSERDRLVFFAARAEALDRRPGRAAYRDACRYVLSLAEDQFAGAAAGIAARLVDIEHEESRRLTSVYSALLTDLSAEGAEYVDERKVAIHKRLSANNADWVGASMADPSGFVQRRVEACNRL